jgi:hypothetical protein
MTARFVISVRNGAPVFSLEYGPPPRFLTKQDRAARVAIDLTDEGEALSFRELLGLFENGQLRDNPKFHKPEPPKLKAPNAKALASYRERRVVWEAKTRPPDVVERLVERRRIIGEAQRRRDAVTAIGVFCRSLSAL